MWQDKNHDLSLKIEQGFGPNGLGILSVTDVCTYFYYFCFFEFNGYSLSMVGVIKYSAMSYNQSGV
jgi:hypothetical protein